MEYKFAGKFDYETQGRNIGTWCPLLQGPCIDADDASLACPWPGDDDCPDEGEWDMIITEKGFVVPSPA